MNTFLPLGLQDKTVNLEQVSGVIIFTAKSRRLGKLSARCTKG